MLRILSESGGIFAIHLLGRAHHPCAGGGTDDQENLALSCQTCNNHKYTRVSALDPFTGEQAPLYNPRRQAWRDHFAWSLDKTLLVGLTSIDRATAHSLDLNRAGVVNLRRVLYALGRHPPNENDALA